MFLLAADGAEDWLGPRLAEGWPADMGPLEGPVFFEAALDAEAFEAACEPPGPAEEATDLVSPVFLEPAPAAPDGAFGVE